MVVMETVDLIGRTEAALNSHQQLAPQQMQQQQGGMSAGPALSSSPLDPALLLQVLAGQLAAPLLPSVGPPIGTSGAGMGGSGVGMGTSFPVPAPAAVSRPQPGSAGAPAAGPGGGGAAAFNTSVLNSLQALISSLQQNVGGAQVLPAGGPAASGNGPLTPAPSSTINPQMSTATAPMGLYGGQPSMPSATESNLSSLQALLSASPLPQPTTSAPPPHLPPSNRSLPPVGDSQQQQQYTPYPQQHQPPQYLPSYPAQSHAPQPPTPLPAQRTQPGYSPDMPAISPQPSQLPGNILALLSKGGVSPQGNQGFSQAPPYAAAAPPFPPNKQQQQWGYKN